MGKHFNQLWIFSGTSFLEKRDSGRRAVLHVFEVLASAPLHTQDTGSVFGALVWQPKRAYQYPTEVASWKRKEGQVASRTARQNMKAGCERHGERESEIKREDKEWRNATKQEGRSDATNLNSKTWCKRSRQNAALLERKCTMIS